MRLEEELAPSILVPDHVEPILGWRSWFVAPTPAGWRLRSVIFDTEWPAGRPLEADCLAPRRRYPTRPWRRRPGHAAIRIDCTCGIYAAESLEQAAAYAASASSARRFGLVLGQAALWGRVIVSEHGWRATHAYPTRLLLPADELRRGYVPSRLFDDLAAYGVPVERLERGLPRSFWP